MVQVTCAGCHERFEAKTKRAKWCTPACKMRAKRRGDVAPAEESKAPAPVDDGLVSAVRAQLAAADRLDTVPGQLAVQLARKLVDVDATGVSGLSKELRAVLAEALEGYEPPAAGDQPAEAADVDDEVTRARRAREQARQAAGLA